MKMHALLAEAVASARSQPVASLLTILVVGALVLSVTLTTGRSIGATRQILEGIDSQMTRTIKIEIADGAGIKVGSISRIDALKEVSWVGAFSNAQDTTNALNPDGSMVPLRTLYTKRFSDLIVQDKSTHGATFAFLSEEALTQLGFEQPVGGIETRDGLIVGVKGTFNTPEFLADLEPLALNLQLPENSSEDIAQIRILVGSAQDVEVVASIALSLLAPSDSSKVSVHLDKSLLDLKEQLQSRLSSFSEALLLFMLLLAGTLIGTILFGIVMMRRKDFGRRRALGATRPIIIGITLTQVLILASLGVIIGEGFGMMVLLILGDPSPGTGFFLAIAILSISTSLLAAIGPGIFASRREPILELRVP